MTGVNVGSEVQAPTSVRGHDRAGPVRPTAGARTALAPVDYRDVVIAGGFWGARQERNRETSIPIGSRRSARRREPGEPAPRRSRRATARASYQGPVFMDSDIYKWLEAVAWELGRADEPELAGGAG